MTTQDKDGQELKTYLEGKDRISDEYRQGATEQPPGHIDATILAASRKAVSSKPKSISFGSRWHVPLSIAAIVVLSVLLVFNIPNDSDPVLFEPARQAPLEVTVEQFGRAAERMEMTLDEVQAKQADAVEDEAVFAPAPAIEMKAMPSSQQLAPEIEATSAVSRDQDVNAPADTLGGALNERENGVASDEFMQESRRVTSGILEESSLATEPQARFRESNAVAGAEADLLQSSTIIECPTPRPEVCAEIYQPVCAIRDTGIRCVTTPCDSTEEIEYSNACSACSIPEVIGYIDGLCE
jgi:hypothetical protein